MTHSLTEKKAYELGGISIGFLCPPALGDSIIAKKVFEAIITLEPNCKIDIFWQANEHYVKAFYGGNKNLNLILDGNKVSNEEIQKYDLVLNAVSHAILFNFVNSERLSKLSPVLFQSIVNVDLYNKQNIYNRDVVSRILFNISKARILGTNRYTSLACNGALPIYDSKVEINLSPEWKKEFNKLKLKKYITVGSNGGPYHALKLKEWPIRYWIEFISLLKSKMPDIKVVQIGGGG